MDHEPNARLMAFAPLPLRLMLGFGLLFHGYPKLFTAHGHESFVGVLGQVGLPAPVLVAYLLGGLEFFGGILLMLGVAVRIVSLLGGVVMLVAALTLPAGFSLLDVTGMTENSAARFGMDGYEVSLLYIAGFLSLAVSGPGAWSLPRIRRGGEKAVSSDAPAPTSVPDEDGQQDEVDE